jgi:hypothetical protein
LERALEETAREKSLSLNKAALFLLRKGAGLDQPGVRRNLIGHALDKYAGTWSEQEARELEDAVQVFEQIEEKLWR